MYLLPQPRHLALHAGIFQLKVLDRITLDGTTPAEALDTAKLLQQEIQQQTGIPMMVDRRTSRAHRGICLGLDASIPEPEGYALEITTEGVRLSAGTEAGLLHGVQTLRQILRQCGPALPCLEIKDAPALPVRGLFYDVTRCRIPTMADLKALVDRCSFYKINQLHLYIEHTFLFDGLSETWRDDTPLTAQDILELDAYCRGKHIDLVPSIATLGHLYKVLRTKTYRHLSEIDDGDNTPFSFVERMAHHTLDTNQEESLELVYRMIDEYAGLFTSRYFNINGDEPFDLGRGRGKAKAEEVGSHQMYVDWLDKVCRHVLALGKRPMFWGDVILAEPERVHQLPEGIICMNWDYDPAPREDHARSLAETGVTQYLCPGSQGWKRTINPYDVAYRNIRKMAELAHKYHGEGLLLTEWGDFGHLQDPECTVPCIAYGAAMGWNDVYPSEEALNAAVSAVEYGDRAAGILDVLRNLSRQVVMSWGMVVEFAEITQGRSTTRTKEAFERDFMPGITQALARREEIAAEIDRCQEAISRAIPNLADGSRMYPFLLMSEGQKCLNRLAAVLFAGARDEALPGDLECWSHAYGERWRETSRQSELYRVQEVIFWIADYLRSGM